MPSPDWNAQLRQLEEQIRIGELPAVRAQLSKLNKAKIPLEHRSALASLARRAELPELCVRLLNPIVHPSKKGFPPATVAQKIEYAAGLTKIGAITEALRILNAADANSYPQALLFGAFARFNQWDYANSVPLLRQYVEVSSLTDYERLVGTLNLISALIYENAFSEAEKRLASALSQSESKYPLLQANTLRLLGLLEMGRKHFSESKAALEKAVVILESSQGMDHFFIRKAGAICRLLESPNSHTLSKLAAIREEAIRKRHWETVRDCDLYRAVATRDENLILEVYTGTPFPGFRARIVREWGAPLLAPKTLTRKFLSAGPSSPLFKLEDYLSLVSDGNLKFGQLIHRLLFLFCGDLYRPFRIATLFEALFPDDFYNPFTSPARVHRSIGRLRKWFRTSGLPFTVEEIGGGYRLGAKKPCSLLVSLETQNASAQITSIEILAKTFRGAFSATEAAKVLRISHRAVLRILHEGLEQNLLVRNGKGPATRYSHKDKLSKTA